MSCYCGKDNCPKCSGSQWAPTVEKEEERRSKKREQKAKLKEERLKREAEALSPDGLEGLEQLNTRVRVTITYNPLTLQIEGDISGLASTLTNPEFLSSLQMFRKSLEQ
jgi:hypothetical protein